MEIANKNIAVQKWVLAVSILIFVIKTAAYWLTNSVAILTDALESTVNVITGFTGLFSLQVAARPRDRNHPYGHGKIELIAAAFEGLLIVIAGLLIVYESLVSFLVPHTIKSLDWGMSLLVGTAVVNYLVGLQCIKVGKKHRSLALTASGKHLQSDAWTTGGIILGLLFLKITEIMWIDSVVAILFAGLIIWEGGKILLATLSGIMDESDDVLLREVVEVLESNKQTNWIDLHNLRIIKYGAVLHLDCHLTVPWYFNVREAHQEIHDLEMLIKNNFPEMPEMFVHTDACLPPIACKLCPILTCEQRQADFEKRIVWEIENLTENKKHSLSNENS